MSDISTLSAINKDKTLFFRLIQLMASILNIITMICNYLQTKNPNTMKKIYLITLLTIFLFPINLVAQETMWNVDKDHSDIQFKTVYMGISDVSGEFTDYKMDVKTNGMNFENASIEVNIQTNSIDTENEKRDGHLKSEDFLYAKEYPELKFKSTSFQKMEDDMYKLKGELTIRGITKTETFDVKFKGKVDQKDMTRVSFKLTGTINRYDYKVDWNKTFSKGFVVSKEVDIICNVNLMHKK